MSEENKTPLLEVKNLKKWFPAKSSPFSKEKVFIKAVDGVSFTLNAGETLGVVGESGCGKSTMGRSVLRLLEPTDGQVLFEGKDYTALKSSELAKSRSDLQIIFQDPYASLDPRMTIGDIIGEPLDIQLKLPTKERMERVLKTMERVGLNTRYVNRYGWVFADPSFGGSAWRAGEKERWNYYFGNLDIFRMPANSEIQKEFMPEKKWLRIDPIDNQRGEFEYEDHGLRFSQLEVSQELISMEDIEK